MKSLLDDIELEHIASTPIDELMSEYGVSESELEEAKNKVLETAKKHKAHREESKQLKARIAELESKIKNAMNVANKYASVDGAHHKNWVINEMVTHLIGKDKRAEKGWDDIDWLDECIAP